MSWLGYECGGEWVTTKIEPNAVSWTPFLKLDMKPLTDFEYRFDPGGASFFVEEEKRTAVVFDIDGPSDGWNHPPCHLTAYIIRENRYLKIVDLRERQDRDALELGDFYPLVCPYSPSLAQINQAT